MIPIPADATVPDIEQWCARGVVMVVLPDRTFPAWYRGVTAGRIVEVAELGTDAPRMVPLTSIRVHWPRCGSVNLPGTHYAVHAARLTQRQYRRTWHVDALNVVTPRTWDVARFTGSNPGALGIRPDTLATACFAPEYPSLDEAEDRINAGRAVSVAITPSVIMAGDAGGKRMFYYHGELLATGYDHQLHVVGPIAKVRRITKLTGDRYYVAPDN